MASTLKGKPPEKKIGPFHGGVGVAVWLNSIDAGNGTKRSVRSITIAPRRYFDRDSNQWKDAPSFNPADLPALIYALQKAQEYCYNEQLPDTDDEIEPEGGPEERF